MTDVPRLGSGIPLVARRDEMRALEDALHRARSGQAGAVLLSGDAGVGKSRLLTELVAQVQAAGDTVLIGRCLDTAEATLPYLPFAETIRQLLQRDPELADRHPPLRRLLPDRYEKLDASPEDWYLGQLQLFDALHAALAELTTERTAILAIEDLHWADRSSRDLLAFLLSRLSSQRLLVIGTYRSDDLHRRHPLRPLLAELVRLPAVSRLHLEPLSLEDSVTFVRTLADPTMPDQVVRNIAKRSEGNPFMAEELLSAYSEHVPHELAEILLARVERLSSQAQQVLRLASVVGRRFAYQRIAAAARCSAAELDEALREAVAHNVIVAEEREAYAFRHALLREALYADLLPGERSRLHADIARVLATDDSPGAAAELAHHSMESHDLSGALAASVRAAREADEVGAPGEMLMHAERALQLWSAVPEPERVCGVDQLLLTRWAARAASASGEPDRALAHSRAAIELADAQGDPLVAADLRRKYATYLFTLPGTEKQAYDVMLEAWELVAGREPSAVKAWVQSTMARAAMYSGRLAEAADLADDAMRIASAVPDDDGAVAATAEAMVTRAMCVGRRQSSPEEVRRTLAEAIELAQRVDARSVEMRARYNYGRTLLEEGRLAEAIVEFDAGVERAVRTGMTWDGYGLELRVVQVIARFMAGDWDGAERAAELAGDAVSGTVLTRLSAAGLLVHVGRGRFDTAERRLAHLRENWRVDTQVMTLLGVCGAELGVWRSRPEEGAQWAEQALQWLRQYEPWHLAAISLCALGIAAYADVAEAARRAGDASGAARAVKSGEDLAALAAETLAKGVVETTEIGPEGRAWMLRVEAEAARLRGVVDPELWRQVVDAFDYGEPYRLAQARWRYAETLLSGGARTDREEAARQLRAATEVAERLHAEPLRQAVAALARRARIALESPVGSGDGQVLDPLTPRERSVLRLVAAGRTNRQIGAELFISEKTVSVHLSRVMAKLGATSRTEAVSTAYARGLLSP